MSSITADTLLRSSSDKSKAAKEEANGNGAAIQKAVFANETDGHRAPQRWERDRGDPRAGKPKKGGAGGKGTWGRPGDEIALYYAGDEILDDDIAAEEEEFEAFRRDVLQRERRALASPDGFHALAEDILTEFYESSDVGEVESRLVEMDDASQHARFVKKMVVFSLGRKGRERELTSVLLSHLSDKILTREEVNQGFRLLLCEVSDILLDHPDAIELLGYFLARAIMDDVVPPAFLKNKGFLKDPKGSRVMALASSLLRMSHAGVRLSHVWGPGDGRPITEVKQSVRQLLVEFLDTNSVDEATRCLKAMEMPHFAHEVVKQGIILGFGEENRKNMASVHDLFQSWFKQSLVSVEQFMLGARRVMDNIEDVKLDYPRMYHGFIVFVSEAVHAGYLRRDWCL